MIGPVPTTQVDAMRRGMWLWDVLFAIATVATVGLIALDGTPAPRTLGASVIVVACWAGWPLFVRREALDGSTARRWVAAYAVAVAAALVAATALAPSANWAAFVVFAELFWLLPLPAAIVATVGLTLLLPLVAPLLRGQPVAGAFFPQSLFLAAFGVLVGVYIHRVARESAERARLIAELEQSQAEAAELSHRAGAAAERERLAGEIHDTLAQGFTSIITLLQAAQTEFDTDAAAARRHVALAVASAKENLQEARGLVAATAPDALAGHSLAHAIGRQVERFAAATGADAAHGTSGTPRKLPAEREVVLLRAAQELLANVTRHAHATTVGVRLDFGDDIVLTVADDGAGFDPCRVGSHSYGLAMMRVRVERMGGRLDIDTAPGAGTTATVAMPT
jgi:signal transduction histidine kinase